MSMEWHLVYSYKLKATRKKRRYEKFVFDRMAIFSTYEEARYYIVMASTVDMRKYVHASNQVYSAHALPLDMSPDEYIETVESDLGAGWKLSFHPWHSMFLEPCSFDRDGKEIFEPDPYYSFYATDTLAKYWESLCAEKEPEFGLGELVYLKGHIFEGTYGVVTGFQTITGYVSTLGNTGTWLGRYRLLIMNEKTNLQEDYFHIMEDTKLVALTCKLPEELLFLDVISRHYKGEAALPENVLAAIPSGAFFRNIESFPFELFEEMGPC